MTRWSNTVGTGATLTALKSTPALPFSRAHNSVARAFRSRTCRCTGDGYSSRTPARHTRSMLLRSRDVTTAWLPLSA